MFHTSCVLYRLVFHGRMVVTTPLSHLGDDPICRIYIFLWKTMSRYVYLHEFQNGFDMIGLGLSILHEEHGRLKASTMH